MSERDPATSPSSMARRSIARAPSRRPSDSTEGLVLFVALAIGLVATLLIWTFFWLRRPFAGVALVFAVGCVTVQTNIAFEEGSGSTRVKAARQDVAQSTSNATSTDVKADIPISLVPK